jgi:DNA polymerase-1
MFTGEKWTLDSYDWPDLTGAKIISFDTETDGRDIYGRHRPVGFSFCTSDGFSQYLPFGHAQGGNLPEDRVVEWAKDNLRDKTIVMAESKFDIHGMSKLGVDFESMGVKPMDVQHDCALLDSRRRSYGLDSMADDFLGLRKVSLPADGLQIYQRLPEVVDYYARYDAELTWKLHKHHEVEIERQGLGRVQRLENDLIYSTLHQERSGLRLDVPRLLNYQKKCVQRYQRIVFELEKMMGFRVIPGKKDDMIRLFKQLNLEFNWTELGNESFSVEYLNKFWHPKYSGGREVLPVKLLTQGLQLRSLDSKYFEKYLKAVDDDGIIRFKLHQLKAETEDGGSAGTVTGRYSASGGSGKDGAKKGFNPQQVYKAEEQVEVEIISDILIKSLFIADEGESVLSCDASQIEYRWFGHYANSPSVTKVYAADPWADFHTVVAEMTGIPRKDAKHANFAMVFGAGPKKFAYMIDKSYDEALPIYRAYQERFPEAKRLLKEASDLAEQRGFVRTLMGRRRRFGKGIDEKYHAALNAVIQGTAADDNKLTVLDLYNNRKSLGVDLRLTFHDEVVMYGKIETDAQCRRIYEFFNEQRLPSRVPILWNLVVADDWAAGDPTWHMKDGKLKVNKLPEAA